jgi:hypothetical protein
MKNLFTIILLILTGLVSLNAQNFTRQIFDDKTKQPIPYVNIGIPSKGFATVSDESGNFSIMLDDKYNNDSLRISMIGYKPIYFKIHADKNQFGNISPKLYMNENSYEINEAVKRPINYKTTIVGNKDIGEPCLSFIGDTSKSNRIYEIGTLITIKKQPTFIDNIKFGVCHNDFDNITIRVNIYTKTNENILKHPIYVTVKKKDKVVTIDTKKYDIKVEDDFIIALEIIQSNDGKGKTIGNKFSFSGGFFGSDMLTRKSIYDKWKKMPFVVVGFNATIIYEYKGNWVTNIFR